MRMDFIRQRYILVVRSSTLVRRWLECILYIALGRTMNVRYVIAHHFVIINTFTSFHSITATSRLCNLSSCIRCVYVFESIHFNTFVKKNVSAHCETRESCYEFSFHNLFHIVYSLALSPSLSLSGSYVPLLPFSIGVFEIVCVLCC